MARLVIPSTEMMRPLKARSASVPHSEPTRSGVLKQPANSAYGQHHGQRRRLSRLRDITHELDVEDDEEEGGDQHWFAGAVKDHIESLNELSPSSDMSSQAPNQGLQDQSQTISAGSLYGLNFGFQDEIVVNPEPGSRLSFFTAKAEPSSQEWEGSVPSNPFTEDMHGSPFSPSSPQPGPGLEKFLRPPSSKIGREEMEYLERKGALSLPPIPLQNALLEVFLDHIYPHLPIINPQRFVRCVQNRDGSKGRVSLLLYQAIMFAASTFIEEDLLIDAGYSSRKEAQETLFKRTRALYDFDYDARRLTMIQVLLLMTYWPGTHNDRKDSWYWMGVAISLAMSINLHRISSWSGMKVSEEKQCRRLWWSCFIKERVMALGTKRPTRIPDECSDAPRVSVDDFEARLFPDDITILSPKFKAERTVRVQEDLARIFISKAQLCMCMGGLLQAPCRSMVHGSEELRLLDRAQIQEMDRELTTWGDSLDECCRYHTISSLGVDNGQSPVVMQRSLLHMLYYTTVCLLHRVQFSPGLGPGQSDELNKFSQLRVQEAARHITRLSEELQVYDLVRFLPATSVVALLSAIVIHLTEMRDEASQVRESAALRFEQCMGVLGELSRIHPAAEEEVQYLNNLVRKIDIARTR